MNLRRSEQRRMEGNDLDTGLTYEILKKKFKKTTIFFHLHEVAVHRL